jgi:hypothetical protein
MSVLHLGLLPDVSGYSLCSSFNKVLATHHSTRQLSPFCRRYRPQLNAKSKTSFAGAHENRPGNPFRYINQTFSSNKFPSSVFVNLGPHSPSSLKKERYY